MHKSTTYWPNWTVIVIHTASQHSGAFTMFSLWESPPSFRQGQDIVLLQRNNLKWRYNNNKKNTICLKAFVSYTYLSSVPLYLPVVLPARVRVALPLFYFFQGTYTVKSILSAVTRHIEMTEKDDGKMKSWHLGTFDSLFQTSNPKI